IVHDDVAELEVAPFAAGFRRDKHLGARAERLMRLILLVSAHLAVEDPDRVAVGKPRADHLDRAEELTEDEHLLARILLEDGTHERVECLELRVFDLASAACEREEGGCLRASILRRKLP